MDLLSNFSTVSIYSISILYSLGLGSVILSLIYVFSDYIYKKKISSITIENNDIMFKWIMQFLTENNYIDQAMNNLKATTKREKKIKSYNEEELEEENENHKVFFFPGSGSHIFYYEKTRVFITINEGKNEIVGVNRKLIRNESINLYCYGVEKINVLKELCQEAFNFAIEKEKGKINIYSIHEWENSWEKCQTKEVRLLKTVILDNNISDIIKNDITNFFNNSTWYKQRGVPYRRGYLLYGPPGCGKSSLIMALAGELHLNICILSLSGSMLDDESLIKLMESVPKRSLILLEDVDSIFLDRESLAEEKQNYNQGRGKKVSFSGLLNALDGVRSQEGSLLFMTTNFVEKLDQALLRPGRADIKLKIDFSSKFQMEKIFQAFFPEENVELSQKFSSCLPEFKISMAKIQGHLMKYKENPLEAINNANNNIIDDINQVFNDMTLLEWLGRLGLEQYNKFFLQQNITRVSQLEFFEEGNFDEKIVNSLHKTRILKMIKGEKSCKEGFKLLSKNSIRSILKGLIGNDKENEGIIERILKIIPDYLVSEFQVRKFVDLKIDRKIDLVERMKIMVKNCKKLKEKDEKNKKMGNVNWELIENEKKYNDINVAEILKNLGCEKYFCKFVKQNCDNGENFLKLDEDDLKDSIEIENFGIRMKINNKIKELNQIEIENEAIGIENFFCESEKSLRRYSF